MKLLKDIKVYQGWASMTTSGASTTTGASIDTVNADEAVIVVNAGTFTGDGSITLSVLECATDDYSSASAITSAAFSAITTTNDAAIHTASIQTKDTKRYIWIKGVRTGSGNCVFGVDVILHKYDAVPPTQGTYERVFDV
jgi:hypothetical protein